MKNLLLFSITLLGMAMPMHDDLPRKAKKEVKKVWKGLETNSWLVIDSVAIKTDIFQIDDEAGKALGYVCLRQAKGCQIGGCDDANGVCTKPQAGFQNNAEYEIFDYFFITDLDFRIKKMRVHNYPGDHGYEITSKRWLEQFEGYKGEYLEFGKDIDGISGATISASSITNDIMDAHDVLREKMGKGL